MTGEGYTACACPNCFEIAIGKPDEAMCHACEKYNCDPTVDHACRVDHCQECMAYKHAPGDCEGCEYNTGEVGK